MLSAQSSRSFFFVRSAPPWAQLPHPLNTHHPHVANSWQGWSVSELAHSLATTIYSPAPRKPHLQGGCPSRRRFGVALSHLSAIRAASGMPPTPTPTVGRTPLTAEIGGGSPVRHAAFRRSAKSASRVERRRPSDLSEPPPLRIEPPTTSHGFHLSINFTRSPRDRRTINVAFSYKARRLSGTLELRKLLFWLVMLAGLLVPASGLKVTPLGRLAASRGPRTARKVHEGLSALEATSDPLKDEISGFVAREADSLLPDTIDSAASGQLHDGTLAAVVGQLTRFVATGEITLDGLKTVAMRACISAVLHKVAMAALDEGNELAAHIGHCLLG